MARSHRGIIKWQVVLAALGGALAVGLTYVWFRSAADPAPASAEPLRVHALGQRILVIAPHPDDEALAPGGIVAEARAAGSQVRVVVLTAGDAYKRAAARLGRGRPTAARFRELGMIRHAESDAALATLEVPQADRIFLAYPDGSLNSLLDRNWDFDQLHYGANGCTSSPYPFAYHPRAPFCGASIEQDLKSIVSAFQPDAVVYPDANDLHHDHWAANALVDYALEGLAYGGNRYTYIAHHGHYPFPWAYMPSAYLRPPSGLEDVGTLWHSVRLSGQAEKLKRTAVGEYHSQMQVPGMPTFLLSFVRRNELFGTFVPATAASSTTNAVPSGSDADGRVIIEPVYGGFRGLIRRRATIADVRLVRGPEVVWMGITTPDTAVADVRYEFHLRLFGGGRPPSRIDVFAVGDDLGVLRPTNENLSPREVSAKRTGNTLWISLPASEFEGRTSCMASGTTRLHYGRGRAYRSSWRPVRL